MDQALCDDAQADNPDPSRLVPVQANLFDDLLQRAHIQTKRIASHAEVLSRVEAQLTAMQDNMHTDIKPKLAAYRRRHRELARKLLRVACRVESAASAGRLKSAEIDRKRRLKATVNALNAPAQFKDKLADLMELADATVLGRSAAPAVEIRDPQAAAVLRDLLADQLKGIEHLSGVCDRDRNRLLVGARNAPTNKRFLPGVYLRSLTFSQLRQKERCKEPPTVNPYEPSMNLTVHFERP